MSETIGVIAEDNSDVEVVKNILAQYVNRNRFSVKKFVGDGCGRVKKNCRSWTKTLFDLGCTHVLILHDLDREKIKSLKDSLNKKVPKSDFPNSIVVIPVEELEAWLLADEIAVKKVFNLDKPFKRISNTELVSSPKERLKELVWKEGKKRYQNTIHNHKIAEVISLESMRRCSSFIPLDTYIQNSIFKLGVKSKKAGQSENKAQ